MQSMIFMWETRAQLGYNREREREELEFCRRNPSCFGGFGRWMPGHICCGSMNTLRQFNVTIQNHDFQICLQQVNHHESSIHAPCSHSSYWLPELLSIYQAWLRRFCLGSTNAPWMDFFRATLGRMFQHISNARLVTRIRQLYQLYLVVHIYVHS